MYKIQIIWKFCTYCIRIEIPEIKFRNNNKNIDAFSHNVLCYINVHCKRLKTNTLGSGGFNGFICLYDIAKENHNRAVI